MRNPVLASLPLAASLAWVAALIVEPAIWDQGSVLLMGTGLSLISTAGTVGTVVTGSLWARRINYAALGGGLGVAVVRPIDLAWMIALVLTGLGVVALGTPGVRMLTRKLPAAGGPPERAVLIVLILMGTPFLLGFAATDESNITTVATGLVAPLAAFWYARVLPGGLYVVRYGWPILALALAPTQELAPALVAATLGVAVAILSHDASVKLAFHPLTERGSTYPIPPELAPREILDAADLDERGKRR